MAGLAVKQHKRASSALTNNLIDLPVADPDELANPAPPKARRAAMRLQR